MSKTRIFTSIVISFCIIFQSHIAIAGTVDLTNDVRVYIETKESLVAKGDQVQQGQTVRAKVWKDVMVDGHVVIAAGTPVVARVDQIKKRKIAGVKGSMAISALETTSSDGQEVQLSGGYQKEGKSRVGLSVSLAVLVFLPLIFIPGKAAELPAGTVFDAYVDRNMKVEVGEIVKSKKINLSEFNSDISAELLYDRLTAVEKPKYFEFEITVDDDATRKFAIVGINSKPIKPIKLENTSEATDDDEVIVTSRVKIKTLVKQFAKGINTIEIAINEPGETASTTMIVDIEI